MKTHPEFVKASTLLALVLLQACGGDPTPGAARTAADADSRAATTLTLLLDDEGRATITEPGAEPADPGARTRSRHYATTAQATHMLDTWGDGAIRIEAGCCGAEAVATAVSVVDGVRGLGGLGLDAPVLVFGNDPRLAATLANTLGEAGHSRVWLVTR